MAVLELAETKKEASVFLREDEASTPLARS
jgi:hypothetical protein